MNQQPNLIPGIVYDSDGAIDLPATLATGYASLQGAITQLTAAQGDITTAISNQNILNNTLSTQFSQATVPTTTSKPVFVKIPDPYHFDGKSDNVEPFIRQVVDSIAINDHAFDTEERKILFMARHLAPGVPLSWYDGILKSNTMVSNDFQAFLKEFREHFGEPDKAAAAARKLEKLVQTGPASHYAATFREILVHLDMTEESKKIAFKKGLKREVLYLLTGSDAPMKTLDDLIKQTIAADNRLFEFRRLHGAPPGASSSNTPSTSKPSSTPAPKSSAATSNPSASATTSNSDAFRPKLTDEQRAERRAKNLCLYCGAEGHKIADCPTRPASGKAETPK